MTTGQKSNQQPANQKVGTGMGRSVGWLINDVQFTICLLNFAIKSACGEENVSQFTLL